VLGAKRSIRSTGALRSSTRDGGKLTTWWLRVRASLRIGEIAKGAFGASKEIAVADARMPPTEVTLRAVTAGSTPRRSGTTS